MAFNLPNTGWRQLGQEVILPLSLQSCDQNMKISRSGFYGNEKKIWAKLANVQQNDFKSNPILQPIIFIPGIIGFMSESMQTHLQIVDEKMICGKEHHCSPCRERAPSCSEITRWTEILDNFGQIF